MAVYLFFGLPGCGKTTLLTKYALDGVKNANYENVYVNVHVAVPGVTYIDNACIGQFELENGLLLIDEATLFADSRDFKNFSRGRLEYFLEHRHRNVDIMLFTQQWDGVDRKIRTITDRVYYIKKGLILGHWFSTCYRIPYDIIIPDPKRSGGEKLGEIIQGYCKPSLFARLFAKRIYRPKYYKYFDSWELEKLPDLPERYKVTSPELVKRYVFKLFLHKSIILLRSLGPKIFGPRCGPSEPLRCPLATFGGFGPVLSRIKIMVLCRSPLRSTPPSDTILHEAGAPVKPFSVRASPFDGGPCCAAACLPWHKSGLPRCRRGSALAGPGQYLRTVPAA